MLKPSDAISVLTSAFPGDDAAVVRARCPNLPPGYNRGAVLAVILDELDDILQKDLGLEIGTSGDDLKGATL